MNPPVGSMIPVTQTSPPARPMISREMSSLWPLPKVWTTPPAAIDFPMRGARRAIAGALASRARASSSTERS
jgi:hypothetical protein